MRWILFLGTIICVNPTLALAQEPHPKEVLVSYQRISGPEDGALSGAMLGLVVHRTRPVAWVVTASLTHLKDGFSYGAPGGGVVITSTDRKVLTAAVGARTHRARGRAVWFAQALAGIRSDRRTNRVESHSPVIEGHPLGDVTFGVSRGSTVAPTFEAGVGMTLQLHSRVGVSGAFDLALVGSRPSGIAKTFSLGLVIGVGRRQP